MRVLHNITITNTKTVTNDSFEVDFSRNNMISFAGSFDHVIKKCGLNVLALSLSENRLGEKFGEANTIFRDFKDLVRLDLSSNEIKTLPRSIFNDLPRLEFLNLGKNAISVITFQILHMKNLHNLDLSDNLLSQLDVKLQSDLKLLKSHSPNFTVHMLGNPFQCSCETHSFLEWMYREQDMFSQFDGLHLHS